MSFLPGSYQNLILGQKFDFCLFVTWEQFKSFWTFCWAVVVTDDFEIIDPCIEA